MTRQKVGKPVSVAFTPEQTAWLKERGNASEAVRAAVEAMMKTEAVHPLRELATQVEREILRLQAAGEPAERLTKELEKVWKLLVQG